MRMRMVLAGDRLALGHRPPGRLGLGFVIVMASLLCLSLPSQRVLAASPSATFLPAAAAGNYAVSSLPSTGVSGQQSLNAARTPFRRRPRRLRSPAQWQPQQQRNLQVHRRSRRRGSPAAAEVVNAWQPESLATALVAPTSTPLPMAS